MAKPLLIFIFTVACGLIAASSVGRAAPPSGELVLEPELTRELNSVLRSGDTLRQALVAQDDEQIDLAIRDLLQQLDHARGVSILAKPHERGHLVRILDSARERFEVAQTSFGQDRKSQLEEAYDQLVNLVRIYKLDRQYSIFFCPKDKTSWVQKGLKAQSPFHPPGREPCGIRVPK